jgi:hypothetical protein
MKHRSSGAIVVWGLILASVLAGQSRATAPELMTYQGRIKESGLPVTGSRSVSIRICPVLSGGVCVDTGSQGVSVVNGLFRTTFTAPSPIAWETGDRYLEIAVGGAPFSPREKLASTPYAIYASSAATLIPNPGDASIFIASNVAIADSGFSVGGSTLVVSAGKVGVGTASPISTLEIKGTQTLSGTSHLHVTGTGAASVTSVGGCPGSTLAGSDGVGRITAGVAGPCTLVFGATWAGSPPVCFFQNESTSSGVYASAPTSFSVTFSGAFVAGNVISYICLGY